MNFTLVEFWKKESYFIQFPNCLFYLNAFFISDPGFVTKHKRSSSGSSSTNSESNLSVSRQTETPNYTDTSSRKTIQTPSPSVAFKSNIRTRPKSFAQKFRPNSRLAGYSSGESPGTYDIYTKITQNRT